ncbi:MAG: hypothetical protein ACE5FD_19410, partial [Anaerolineae bacterium]
GVTRCGDVPSPVVAGDDMVMGWVLVVSVGLALRLPPAVAKAGGGELVNFVTEFRNWVKLFFISIRKSFFVDFLQESARVRKMLDTTYSEHGCAGLSDTGPKIGQSCQSLRLTSS